MRRTTQAAHKACKNSLLNRAARPRLVPACATSISFEVGSSEWHRGGSRRSFFGLGEVLGVLSNPAETLRSLSDAKKQLEEMQQELKDAKERSQIPASHTFSPLPGFFDRPNEIKAIERALGSVPAFTVLFGSSSVGKTALLRQVLSNSDKYHVLHFDLRIAGFADLSSLYFSLSRQLESYFAVIPKQMGSEWGWDEFEKESWAFKHDRIEVEKRIENGGEVKTADVSRLMEILQSSLLAYWDFVPMTEAQRKKQKEEQEEEKNASSSTKASTTSGSDPSPASNMLNDPTEARMRAGAVPKPEREGKQTLVEARSLGEDLQKEEKDAKEVEKETEMEEKKPRSKKIPVIFIDEAHKLPALIQADDAMKAILDSLLVLTKQDRLAHTLLATSDSFFMTWLRAWNTAQHCQILSIGDCSKSEAKRFVEEVLTPHVPDKYRSKYNFGELYKVFGGKLAHLSDFTGEFVNSEGELEMLHSSHFLQAHALLNLQLIHARPPGTADEKDENESSTGFKIYSPLQGSAPAGTGSPTGSHSADFTVHDLLTVMSRLAPGKLEALPYFALCREMGAQAVDGMVRGRILELRWSSTVTEEGEASSVLDSEKQKKIVGPVLVPTTPVIKFAMAQVLEEWKDVLEK
ncbi:hypothetical protein JCM5350_002977 [Sporobolomyces pararoseus]